MNRSKDPLFRLHGLRRFGVRLGLDGIRQLLASLGDPQGNYPVIHLAGTNGKGSTAAILAACLEAHGLRVGLFTSPHLSRFSERIRVSGIEISPISLATLVERAIALNPEATYFEVATAVAFTHFSDEKVDVAVIETGLGGRYDATNVVLPIATIITNIGLDHTGILGETLPLVAAEKAGIIKAGVPVIVATGAAETIDVMRGRASEIDARVYLQGTDFDCRAAGKKLHFKGMGWQGEYPRPPLAGAHQTENTALALATMAVLGAIGPKRLTPKVAAEGLVAVSWPGRGERIGRFLLDVAHNPNAAKSLAELVRDDLGNGHVRALFGVLDDKDIDGILDPLLPLLNSWDFVAVDNPRSADPKLLANRFGGRAFSSITDALGAVGQGTADDGNGTVLITGSVYLVGAARALLLGTAVDAQPTADPLYGYSATACRGKRTVRKE